MVKIAVGCDHAGLALKQELADILEQSGHEVSDLGTHSDDRVDYPDFGAAVGRAIANQEADLGVCVCGSGIGIAMAANKIPGVRAATLYDVTSARLSRQHNNANIACFGARLIGSETAKQALTTFLETDFEGGRHKPRIKKLDEL